MREDDKEIKNVECICEMLKGEAAAVHPHLQPGDYLRLSVTDTGHGIPSDILDNIFEP